MKFHGSLIALCFLTLTVAGCFDINPGIPSSTPPSSDSSEPSVSPAAPKNLPAPTITGILPETSLGIDSNNRISVLGSGFQPGIEIYFGDSLYHAVFFTNNEVRIQLDQETPLPTGPVNIRVKNPDGKEALLEKGFFSFSEPQWSSLSRQLFGDVNEILVVGGVPYVASSSGLFALQDGGWRQITGGDVSQLTHIASRNEIYAIQSYWIDDTVGDPCPTCSGAAFYNPFMPKGLSRLGADGTWSPITEFDQEYPIALSLAAGNLYLLTGAGIKVMAPADGVWSQIYPAFGYEGPPYLLESGGPISFQVIDQSDAIHFLIGNDFGLYHSRRSKTSGDISGWSLIGPIRRNCDERLPSGVCGSSIRDLHVDPTEGALYVSFEERSSWTEPRTLTNWALGYQAHGSGVIKVPLSEFSHIDATYCSVTTCSLYYPSEPWVELPLGQPVTMTSTPTSVIGVWHDHSGDLHDTLHEMPHTGGVRDIGSSFELYGLPPLPYGAYHRYSALTYDDGYLYTYHGERGCLSKSPWPGWSPIVCLGGERNLGDRYIKFLFEDSGSIGAATDDGVFFFDRESGLWQSSLQAENTALREDQDFFVLTHWNGLEGWPVYAALSLPVFDLDFVSTSEGVFVRHRQGSWIRIGDERFIRSLVYDEDSGILYGASLFRGVFEIKIP